MFRPGAAAGEGGNWRDNALIVTDGHRVLDRQLCTLYFMCCNEEISLRSNKFVIFIFSQLISV